MPAAPSSRADGRRDDRASEPRLRRSEEIRRTLREGESRRSGRVVLYVAPADGPSRAAWVTGKRVGGAVARNRARRLLREAWRALWPRVRDGHDLVLVARGPFGGAKAPEVTDEIEDLLSQAGLLR